MHTNDSHRIVSDESSFNVPDYGLDPADNAIAHEIVNFDPVGDVRGPVSDKLHDDPNSAGGTLTQGDTGRWAARIPAQVPLTALPPHLADPIKAELAAVTADRRPALEAKLVNAALRQNSLQLRVSAGPGAGANAYVRESFEQAKERQDLQNEEWRLRTELAEVSHWDTVVDEATGQPKPVPVDRVQGRARQLKEARLSEIERNLAALEIEGPQRLKKALQEAVKAEKSKRQQLEDHIEVDRRARAQAREDRINERAAVRARILKSSVDYSSGASRIA